MKSSRQSIGLFEQVTFPDLISGEWIAKIDTGAYTGALHCTKVREEHTPGGVVLHFAPFDHPSEEITVSEFETKYVRSSNGGRAKRYFVNTSVTINGKTYPITLSLADRSDMRWPVLIGRKFLRVNHLIVDVTKSKPYGGRKR